MVEPRLKRRSGSSPNLKVFNSMAQFYIISRERRMQVRTHDGLKTQLAPCYRKYQGTPGEGWGAAWSHEHLVFSPLPWIAITLFSRLSESFLAGR